MADPRPTPAAIRLDAPGMTAGAMERFFLLEATMPGQRSDVAGDNLKAMRLMRQVIENRLQSPGARFRFLTTLSATTSTPPRPPDAPALR